MKVSEIKTTYDLMKYCKKPLYFQSNLRNMKVGDTYLLGICREIDGDNQKSFVAEAWIEKHRSLYEFYGTWTIPTNPRRGFIMTNGSFKILKGGIIQFIHNASSIQAFALICRRLKWLETKLSCDTIELYQSRSLMPFASGLWLNSEYINRKPFLNHKEYRWEYLDCAAYAPTQQLEAIVTAGIALELINSPSCVDFDDLSDIEKQMVGLLKSGYTQQAISSPLITSRASLVRKMHTICKK